MEKELKFETSSPENFPEKKDRFMELMEERHLNAITAFKIEKILSQEEPSDEYPTTKTPENIRVKRIAHEALGPIVDSLSAAGYMSKTEHAQDAIDSYLMEKVRAQRAELELKEKLEGEGKNPTPQEMGQELFFQRTGQNPVKSVEAVRQEGYFVLAFFHDDDYSKFIGESDRDESVGRFHRAMRFPDMTVDVILSKHGLSNKILLHERQHFINNSVFQDFLGIENQSVPSKQEFPLLAEGVNKQKTKVRKGLKGELKMSYWLAFVTAQMLLAAPIFLVRIFMDTCEKSSQKMSKRK